MGDFFIYNEFILMGFNQLKLAFSLFTVTTSWIQDLLTGDRVSVPTRAEQLK